VRLVRHCEPAGRGDVGLSDAGREHAHELAARVGPVESLWTSPLLRARETAAALGSQPRVDDDLREIDFGDFEGRAFDEIAASDPELYRSWMEAPTRVRFPGGECWPELKERVLRSLERIEGDAVVVTHAGVIRAALSEWLGIPDEAIFRIGLDYGGITVFEDGIVRKVNA